MSTSSTQCEILRRLKIVLVRCMVYYHTEDEWEQTMEVMFVKKVATHLYNVLWGWVSLIWTLTNFFP